MFNFSYKKISSYLVGSIALGSLLLAPTQIAHAGFMDVLNTFADIPSLLMSTLGYVVGILLAVAFYLSTILLWLSGEIFDFAIKISIFDFPMYANMDAIKTIWGVGRDLSNFFFIFIILYSAIGTILGLDKANLGKNLTKIIIVAIFINFSLPIGRVVIDASNVLAVEFYNKTFQGKDGPAKLLITAVEPFVGSIIKGEFSAETGSSLSSLSESLNYKNFLGSGQAFFMKYLMGTIFIFVTAHVLLAGAALLIFRVVVLLFILALSSLAFFSSIVPRAEKYYGEWWDYLINQSIFAPAYMFMLYFVFHVIALNAKDGGLAGVLKKSTDAATAASASSKSSIVSTLGLEDSLQVFVYFLLLIGLMTGALVVAKKLGAYGAGMAEGFAKKAVDFLGAPVNAYAQRTAGYALRNVGKLPGGGGQNLGARIESFARSNPLIGGAALRGLRTIETTGSEAFGRKQTLENLNATAAEFQDNPGEQAELIANIGDGALQTKAYEKLSDRQKIALLDAAEKSGDANRVAAIKKLQEAYVGKEPEKAEKFAAEKKKVEEAEEKRKNKELVEGVKNPTTGVLEGGIAAGFNATDPLARKKQIEALKKLAPDDIAGILKVKRDEEGNATGPNPRTNPDILEAITPAQMKQLIMKGNLHEEEQLAIRNFLQGKGLNDPKGRLLKDELLKPNLGI